MFARRSIRAAARYRFHRAKSKGPKTQAARSRIAVKSAEQQSQLMLHRTRDLLMRQRTQVINALRAHLAELGITAAQGNAGLRELLAIIAGAADERLPAEAHASLIVQAKRPRRMRNPSCLISCIRPGPAGGSLAGLGKHGGTKPALRRRAGSSMGYGAKNTVRDRAQ